MHESLERPNVVVAAMTDLFSMAEWAAKSSANVLVTGESGVGKDLIARHIHTLSSRKNAAFVAVNCAGLTETLLESELFGHVKGSFTGAFRDKRGKLQLAHGGTLFLDEVGEMSLRMQALLLRFLENGEIQAVVSDQTQALVDVRVVAATSRNLQDLVAAGQFREDLLYRLRVIHLHVPPLRKRPEDVRALVYQFAERAERNLTFRRSEVADDLYDALARRGASFWEHVYPMFLSRDITRHDLRELVHRGLRESRGRSKSLLELFGISSGDSRRFMNFLAAHECSVEFEFHIEGLEQSGQAAPKPSSTGEFIDVHVA